MTEQKPDVLLPPVEQVGIVVHDIDSAIEYYSSTFGWGPFQVREAEMTGALYEGRPEDCRLKLAFARSGPIEIELIQVLDGRTPHSEFLKEKGEGLQHLRFRVDDLESALARLSGTGTNPVWRKSYPELGMAFAYLSSDETGGVMFELLERRNAERRSKDEGNDP